MQTNKPKFSLKDHLFNPEKITKIALEIQAVYPQFDTHSFVTTILHKFPELELKARIDWIATVLKMHLPDSFQQATTLLLNALPAPCDPTKTDNDFGEFIYAPYATFVAKYGCHQDHVAFSLNALKEMTTRFSAEDAIRYFINAFPEKSLEVLKEWAQDSHYHVRRLASEGTRPKLPWSQNIALSPEQAIPILDVLYSDNTRYVTRSVANHLNDISKINPALTLTTLERWYHAKKQTTPEMAYIKKHALRTLIKKGHPEAIASLDFSPNPDIIISPITILQNPVKIGQSVTFSFTLTAQKNERLIIDYILHFQNKAGVLANKKVHKLKQIELAKNQSIQLSKTHPLRANMTTRSLYPGEHKINIQINGKIMNTISFNLVNS
ncbi:MAG: DNA alkylation repair protein [Candidatus Margulisbacteria bacterium]|nr:DNA alkylation repair protein [Candidatus Margulisiibacteriota bacterium]